MEQDTRAAGRATIERTAANDQPALDLRVRHFRPIVLWPLQIMPSNGRPVSADRLLQELAPGTWSLVEDEFGNNEEPLQERHYREFVSFLPHVQRSLYGDAAGPVRQLGYGDTVQYLDSDMLRRQSASMHRLTVVTTLGLIGTTATGFLGMNLIAAADAPFGYKLVAFAIVTAATVALTALTMKFSKRLTVLFDRLSGDRH